VKPFPHEYDVHLAGGPSGYAMLSTPGIPDLSTAPPADFDGVAELWFDDLAAVGPSLFFMLGPNPTGTRTALDIAGKIGQLGRGKLNPLPQRRQRHPAHELV